MKLILALLLLSSFAFAGPSAGLNKKNPRLPSQTPALKQTSSIVFKSLSTGTEFLAVGKPAMIKINGKGPGPEGTISYSSDSISGVVKVDLTKLTTEIELRDDHLKNKYLEVKKYPTADLIFKNFKLPIAVDSLSNSETEIPFNADLTLHGKSNPISGLLKIKKNLKLVSGTAEFTINIMDFLETLPNYAGIKVADKVQVKIKLSGQVQ